MRIEYGYTRVVILIGGIAIKIARIVKPIHWTRRFLYWRRRGGASTRLCRYGNGPESGLWAYLTEPLRANLLESSVWKAHHELPLAPTLFSLVGLVNVQRRGCPIEAHELADSPFRQQAANQPELTDLHKPYHFARIDGRICLVDYGQRSVVEAIVQSSTRRAGRAQGVGHRKPG